MKCIELGNVYDMIQYFKVNWRKLEKLKKKKKILTVSTLGT